MEDTGRSDDLTVAHRIEVRYPGGTYPVLVGVGLRHRLGAWLAQGPYTRRAFVVTDEPVAALYGDDVVRSLEAAGFVVQPVVVPPGEAHKTLDTVRHLYNVFVTHHIDRRTPVIALGGGVIGDLTGFAAATILRGVPFIQVPTTLLAMVDASVGGKTGVDLPQGKNLVGAFKFPDLVLADVETLYSLPPVEVACGMAEVIKHGLIGDPGILDLIAQGEPDLLHLVVRAVQVKVDVVEADPFEGGRRAVLNLGHTFGHALEQVTAYRLRHGLAVALGLVAAAHLGVLLGEAHPDLVGRVRYILRQARLPTHWRDLAEGGAPPSVERVLAAMGTDKKRLHGRLRFVIPRRPGDVVVRDDVPPHLVRKALATILT